MSKKVTRAELVDEFNRLAQELGKRPTLTEYNEHGKYSSTPVYKRFESFEELKEEAGFETGQQKHTDDELLDDLRRVAEKIGRTPTVEAYNEHGSHDFKTLKRRFGSWHDVLVEGGFEPTEHSEHWQDTEYDYEPPEGNVAIVCDYCGGTDKKWKNQVENNENTFCSRDCKGDYMSEQTGEDARSWDGGKVEIVCEWCGDTKEVKPAEVDNARFCQQDCMIEWRSKEFSGEDHPRWVDNPKYRYYGPNWDEQAEKTRQRDNYQCQLCDRTNEDSLEKWDESLSVHHIIRFYDFESYNTANELENLVTACKEHHTLLDLGLEQPPEEHVDRLNAWLDSLEQAEKPTNN